MNNLSEVVSALLHKFSAEANASDAARAAAVGQAQERFGDGCYHVFMDVGSNRGVHGRFRRAASTQTQLYVRKIVQI